MGAKLDSAINQAGLSTSSQGYDNINQKHPIWTEQAPKTGSEGLGSQSNQQPTSFQSSLDKDSTFQKAGDWTDTSTKIGSDQRENVGAYSTSTYPTETTGTSLSHTYDTSTYPSSTTGTSLSQTYGSASTYPSTTIGTSPELQKDYHVSDSKHDETKISSSEHKPTVTEKIKEKTHQFAEKVKEAFT